jgi:hypothetical protein
VPTQPNFQRWIEGRETLEPADVREAVVMRLRALA